MTKRKFEVQTQFIYGWENVWQCDGELETFDTLADAQKALDDFFNDLKEDGMSDDYSRDDYRIVEVK